KRVDSEEACLNRSGAADGIEVTVFQITKESLMVVLSITQEQAIHRAKRALVDLRAIQRVVVRDGIIGDLLGESMPSCHPSDSMIVSQSESNEVRPDAGHVLR